LRQRPGGGFMHFVNRTHGDLSVHEISGVTGLSSASAVKRIPLKRVGEVRLKRNKRSSDPKEQSMYNNNNNVETGEAEA
jgi:precorrin-2 methylase